MIKFKATGPTGREVIGFGLSAQNIGRLKAGLPIHIYGAEWNTPFDVVILYGETEEQLVRMLRKGGAVDDTTAIIGTTERKTRQ